MKNKDVTRCSVPLVPITLQTSLLHSGREFQQTHCRDHL
jgi:hypothetical protein